MLTFRTWLGAPRNSQRFLALWHWAKPREHDWPESPQTLGQLKKLVPRSLWTELSEAWLVWERETANLRRGRSNRCAHCGGSLSPDIYGDPTCLICGWTDYGRGSASGHL